MRDHLTRRKSFRRRGLESLQGLLGRTALPEAYVRARALNGAVILMYHSVADDASRQYIDPSNWVSPKQFEIHARYLARHRKVVSLSALLHMIRERLPIPPGTVVLSFDDGYLDNFEVAFPLLARYELPATLFVATAYVENSQNQWIDRLYSCFRFRTRPANTAAVVPFSDVRPSEAAEIAAYATLRDKLLEADYEERESILKELEETLRPNHVSKRLTLSWAELKDIGRSFPLIEIGSHSATHCDLTAMTDRRIREELAVSKSAIESNLNREITLFSYPYNRASPHACRAVQESGYDAGVAGAGASPRVDANSNPFALPRLEAQWGLGSLALTTSGAYPELSLGMFGRA